MSLIHQNALRVNRPLNEREEYLIKQLVSIGQAHILTEALLHSEAAFKALIEVLGEIEAFYEEIGGIAGYQTLVLDLLRKKKKRASKQNRFHRPIGPDLSQESGDIRKAVMGGLELLEVMAEIYPVGGAGDRLGLVDPISGESLPTACLPFQGRTLLEGLVRDLQARESLYYKLYGKQVVVPIILMTSHEKRNQERIFEIFSSNKWFGRPPDTIRFCVQPLVPMVTELGQWVMASETELYLKPGGHGVLWKLLKKEGIFQWLLDNGKEKALIRQINNPIAGVDHGLLAFSGWGYLHQKEFGFAACERKADAAEGILVLEETEEERGFSYRHRNIEYTEFEKYGLKDSTFYPANTNLLFVDLKAILKRLDICPFPGALLNMKHDFGPALRIGRLESTMQNLSDEVRDHFSSPLKKGESMRSYVTYNARLKTISTTKKSRQEGQSLQETPEGCFGDLMRNARQLLIKCGIQLPLEESDVIFRYHPALGPLYAVIAQKIRGGHIEGSSEIEFEISELDVEAIAVKGSLLVKADSPLGRCTLRQVCIENKGLDFEAAGQLWNDTLPRSEALKVILEGNGEFIAENVFFQGDQTFHVPSGHRLVVSEEAGDLQTRLERLSAPTWHWIYQRDGDQIRLDREVF